MERIKMLLVKSVLMVGRLLGCLLVLGATVASQSLRLYVGNSRGDDISIVDLASFKVVGDIKLGDRIHGVAIQPDGKRLFVTVESDHTLRIVDTATQETVGTVKVSGRPNQIAVTPDGKYVAVPIRDGDRVEIVDVGKLEVVKSLPIKEPHNALSTDSNRYLYVSAMSGHEIDIIDLEKMEYSAQIPVGGRPRPYVVSSDGKTMFVALAELHGFVIVDVPGKRVVERVEIPAEHATPHPLKYESADTRTHGLGLTPDGGELWVTSLLDDCVYIYDTKSKKIVGKVATGDGPNWLAFTPDGKYLCVSNADSDDVSIIDVKTRHEVTRVKVGKAPKRLAIPTAAHNSQP
jgi:YVTN family beta-propeller protein